MPLFFETWLILLAAFLIGLGIAWLIWARL